MSDSHRAHGPHELCAAGTALYATALRGGSVRREATVHVPCLLTAGLLRPDPHGSDLLVATPPSLALPRLLQGLEEEIATARRGQVRLAEVFTPLLAGPAQTPSRLPDVDLLSAGPRMEEAIDRAVDGCREEVLTIQPGLRPPESLGKSRPRDRKLLGAGVGIRNLYQHTNRHSPVVAAHFEDLDGDVQVRTLDEVTERLLVFDRKVAFITADESRALTLEVRHPSLVDFFVGIHALLWRLATPLYPVTAPLPVTGGITARQRTVAALVAEGETDARIAERLGMNVRTSRAHIAALSETLGSRSRGQLGYLIGTSGILGPTTAADDAGRPGGTPALPPDSTDARRRVHGTHPGPERSEPTRRGST